MECKFCRQMLEEGNSVCPHCGKDNAAEEMTEEVTQVPVEETEEAAEPAVETAELPAEETFEIPAVEEKTEKKSGITVTPGKLAVAIVAGILVVAALVAIILYSLGISINFTKETEPATEPEVVATVPTDGNPDDVTCKGTYTASDDVVAAAKDTVVATVGDKELTSGQLQVYYWMKVQQMVSEGHLTNYTQGLDTQICTLSEEGLTWQQFILDSALSEWQYYQSIALAGEKNGYTMDEETKAYLESMSASLETSALEQGFANAEELLAFNVGKGSSMAAYYRYQEIYNQAVMYIDGEYKGCEPTMEDVEAYFMENETKLAEQGVTRDGFYVDVRHILLLPEDAPATEPTEPSETTAPVETTVPAETTAPGETTVPTEAPEEPRWAACREEAQAILDAYLAGEELTEDAFAALANEKSEDPGSNTNGGLYENVYEGQTVEPFENWCFDENRQPGDTGLVKTSYGYHVMYFVKRTPIWEATSRNNLRTEYASGLVKKANEDYPITVDYSAIVLGHVDINTWFEV